MAGETPKCETGQQLSVNIEKIRSLVQGYIAKHQYQSAVFWADKAVSLTNGDVPDVYWYAQALYLTGQYHRAENMLKQAKLDKNYTAGCFLAAKCLYECKEYKQALEVLDQTDSGPLGVKPNTSHKLLTHPDIPSEKMESSLHLLRGRVYEALENRGLACECFRQALRDDVYCYEAFDALVSHHMMTAMEETALIASLPFGKQCTEEEADLLRFLYENKLKKYHKPSELAIPTHLSPLNSNLDVMVNLAERHYYNCDFREAHAITARVLKKDPFNETCLPLHISILVELKLSNDLFSMAHNLVLLYPQKAVAWFAVGCYYLSVNNNELARRYLQKATTLERTYGPAWLAFGHGFAADSERDQAMAAYFTASQIMKGCHLPVLYIGLEYGLTNNVKLAERFFSQALEIAPEDPFVLHEMGVVAFQNQDYQAAERYYREALGKVQSLSSTAVLAEKWEPLLNNLAHTCRKLKKYSSALEYHRQALIICPQSPSTLSAIGFVYSLLGAYEYAIDYLHRALGLRRDDTFATTMLNYAVETHMAEAEPIAGFEDGIPTYTYTGRLNISSAVNDLKAGSEEELPESSHLEGNSTLESSAIEEGEVSMASSGMAIDTDMDDS